MYETTYGPVPNHKPVMGSSPNQFDTKNFSVSRNIHISQKYSSFVSQCTVNLKELVAFDILVTLYEWFGYNCVCLPHKSCRRTNLNNFVFSLCP